MSSNSSTLPGIWHPSAKDCGDTPARPSAGTKSGVFCCVATSTLPNFHLYGISRDDVDYVMETSPSSSARTKHSTASTVLKRVILEMYDAMQRAIDTGEP